MSRFGYAVVAALAIAACSPTQPARPVSAPVAPQPTPAAPHNAASSARPVLAPAAPQLTAAAPQNATSSARPWGPSEEEMSRTRGPGWILARTIGRDRLYLHQTTMAHQGGVVQAWLTINAWEPLRRPSGFFVRSTLTLYQVECGARLMRLLDFKFYSDRGASGDVENAFFPDMAAWRPIEPGSVSEALMDVACQRRPQAPPASEPTGRPSQPPSSLGPVKDPL